MLIKSPNATDKHVGARVRMRRLMLGMSQTQLGDALGITFQQVQKYEKGTNRISASRLQQISDILQVEVPFFFEGLPDVSGLSGKDTAPPSLSYGRKDPANVLGLERRSITRWDGTGAYYTERSGDTADAEFTEAAPCPTTGSKRMTVSPGPKKLARRCSLMTPRRSPSPSRVRRDW
jgi:transcriptional regulator with XRE-family HTH domain